MFVSRRLIVLSFIIAVGMLWSHHLQAQALGTTFSYIEPTTVSVEEQDDTDTSLSTLFIRFNLIDQDAPREAHPVTGRYTAPIVRDSWTTACQPESPTDVGQGLPAGWQSPEPSVRVRELDAVTCERYLDLSATGIVGGHNLQNRTIRWQPGPNGGYGIGIPTQGTKTFTVVFPKLITTDAWVYTPEHEIVIAPTAGMRTISIDVPLRRYAKILLRTNMSAHEHPTSLLSTSFVAGQDHEMFVQSGVHPLRAQEGHLFSIVDLRPDGTTGSSFPRGMSYRSLEVEFKKGWTYVVTLHRQPGLALSLP